MASLFDSAGEPREPHVEGAAEFCSREAQARGALRRARENYLVRYAPFVARRALEGESSKRPPALPGLPPLPLSHGAVGRVCRCFPPPYPPVHTRHTATHCFPVPSLFSPPPLPPFPSRSLLSRGAAAIAMAAVSSYLEQMLSGMDRQLAGFKDECNALAEQHQAWLAETVQTNTKRLQYQTCATPAERGCSAAFEANSRVCAGWLLREPAVPLMLCVPLLLQEPGAGMPTIASTSGCQGPTPAASCGEGGRRGPGGQGERLG